MARFRRLRPAVGLLMQLQPEPKRQNLKLTVPCLKKCIYTKSFSFPLIGGLEVGAHLPYEPELHIQIQATNLGLPELTSYPETRALSPTTSVPRKAPNGFHCGPKYHPEGGGTPNTIGCCVPFVGTDNSGEFVIFDRQSS